MFVTLTVEANTYAQLYRSELTDLCFFYFPFVKQFFDWPNSHGILEMQGWNMKRDAWKSGRESLKSNDYTPLLIVDSQSRNSFG